MLRRFGLWIFIFLLIVFVFMRTRSTLSQTDQGSGQGSVFALLQKPVVKTVSGTVIGYTLRGNVVKYKTERAGSMDVMIALVGDPLQNLYAVRILRTEAGYTWRTYAAKDGKVDTEVRVGTDELKRRLAGTTAVIFTLSFDQSHASREDVQAMETLDALENGNWKVAQAQTFVVDSVGIVKK